ncbi:MAG: NAD(P)H-quinone oxidoreductase [Cellvibrio sp.]|nr:NAD(P)H-quinone oxidoreductase [Cellvibrio sp.]
MKSIHLEKPGSAENLSLIDTEIPVPKEDEVLIRVHAAGVNRPDILQREGLYPPPTDASPVLGLEVAGEVVVCGKQARSLQVGDKVCALVNGGGYAEYAVAPHSQCIPIPKNYSYEQAAAIPETFFTVWHNLFQRAKLTAGKTLLIHSGASGIGTTAIQLASVFGAKVYATASTPEKCEAISRLGAEAICYTDEDFVAAIKKRTHGQGVNIILDVVGGDNVQKNFSVAALEGRIVNIAFLNGSKMNLDLMPLMLKRLTLTGSTLRSQSSSIKAKIADELLQHVWPLLNQEKIKPVIDSIYSLSDVVKAHQRMESNLHIGKIILIP